MRTSGVLPRWTPSTRLAVRLGLRTTRRAAHRIASQHITTPPITGRLPSLNRASHHHAATHRPPHNAPRTAHRATSHTAQHAQDAHCEIPYRTVAVWSDLLPRQCRLRLRLRLRQRQRARPRQTHTDRPRTAPTRMQAHIHTRRAHTAHAVHAAAHARTHASPPQCTRGAPPLLCSALLCSALRCKAHTQRGSLTHPSVRPSVRASVRARPISA